MSECTVTVVDLPCDRGGFGYLDACLLAGDKQLFLQDGGGNNFPDLLDGEVFYVQVSNCNGLCCEIMQVTAKVGDVLYVERDANPCDQFDGGTRVSYCINHVKAILAIASSMGIKVVSPLMFDECTRTLSIDCSALPNSGCGCGSSGGGSGEQGPPGPPGKDGKNGVSITSASVSLDGLLSLGLSDGTTVTAIGNVKGPQGVQGVQGVQGPPGPEGDTGPEGVGIISIYVSPDNKLMVQLSDQEQATSVGTISVPAGEGFSTATVDTSGKLIITKTDGSTIDAGTVIGPQGPIGPSLQFDTLIFNSKLYILGIPGESVSVVASNNGAVIGPYVIGANGLWTGNNPMTGFEAQVYYIQYNGKYVATGVHSG